MGPSGGAFLGILFFSGALGKGGLGNSQGQRAGTGACARAGMVDGEGADRGEEK